MFQLLTRLLPRAVALLALVPLAAAQVLYETRFDDDSGWTFDAPNGLGTEWKVDNRPGTAPFGPWRSEPSSLNYNNDVDYAGNALSAGKSAFSPVIAIGGASGVPTLVFWCNRRLSEVSCDVHEQLTLRIREGSIVRLSTCLTCSNCVGAPLLLSPCSLNGWHEHVVPLDASWGNIRVEFNFRGDAIANDGAGYFVDDLTIVDMAPTSTYCIAKPNSLGCVAAITTSGAPDLTSNDAFTITASQVLNQKNGVFFYGAGGPNAAPFLGGTLCVRSPVKRMPPTNSNGNPQPEDCSGTLAIDFNAWLRGGFDPMLSAGQRINGQFWYRDPADPFRAGLSGGIEFAVLP
ncbi:MAG: hypothetical protein HUU28_06815 [Planctomycetaceae bacterium]|nr:hypothetical protein [Planctomycetaceae bacterium]